MGMPFAIFFRNGVIAFIRTSCTLDKWKCSYYNCNVSTFQEIVRFPYLRKNKTNIGVYLKENAFCSSLHFNDSHSLFVNIFNA